MRPDDNPFVTFGRWFADAEASEPNDPNAMTLATSTKDGFPSARMVLLKGWDERGFVFYTNLSSRKGHELEENPRCALLFHWKSRRRQVRIEGDAVRVADDEADAYFASRPRDSQIGAWASKQSQPLTSRGDFEARIARFAAKYVVGPVPRPPFWSGFRVAPRACEFWEDRPFRLHMRFRFERVASDAATKATETTWRSTELFP
jgi:pyridoxamine 5'-phosphate oxidase